MPVNSVGMLNGDGNMRRQLFKYLVVVILFSSLIFVHNIWKHLMRQSQYSRVRIQTFWLAQYMREAGTFPPTPRAVYEATQVLSNSNAPLYLLNDWGGTNVYAVQYESNMVHLYGISVGKNQRLGGWDDVMCRLSFQDTNAVPASPLNTAEVAHRGVRVGNENSK